MSWSVFIALTKWWKCLLKQKLSYSRSLINYAYHASIWKARYEKTYINFTSVKFMHDEVIEIV